MIGELYLEIDDVTKAKDYFLQALAISEEINSRPDLANANYNLGLLYQRQGRKNLAREYWRQAQEIFHQTDLERYQEIKKQLQDLETF